MQVFSLSYLILVLSGVNFYLQNAAFSYSNTIKLSILSAEI